MLTKEDKERFDRAFADVPRLQCGIKEIEERAFSESLMKLYNVSIESILVVAANNRDEAIRKGRGLLRYNRSATDALSVNWAERIHDADDLVKGWNPKYMPYGLPPGDVRSIEEVLKV